MIPPSSAEEKASGIKANVVVKAVINIGLTLVLPPSIRAEYTSIPLSLSCLTKVINTMALVTTTPINKRNPIRADRLRVRSEIVRATSAPTIARGRLKTMINGSRIEPRVVTITK